MKRKASLEMSIYEYLKYCDEKRKIKGGGLITDKQSIFYSAVEPDDYSTHDNIGVDLENAIHPQRQKIAWDAFRNNNIHIYTIPPTIIINLPENKELSKSQLFFLEDFLNQINQYIKQPKSKKIELDIITGTRKDLSNKDRSIEEIKKELREMVTNNITIEEEKIIGKTLDKNKIKSNILYHIDFSKCKSIIDLIDKLLICKEYNNDKYYESIFKELFPQHNKIEDLIYILYVVEIDESIIKKININNIEEVLYEELKNSFKNKKLYQINNILSKLKSYCGNNKEIEKLFPNYEILLQIINIIDEKRIDAIDRIISKASSYEEVSNILMNIKEINQSEKENQVNKYNKFINALNNTILKKHQILENKEEIKKIIASNNSLNNSLDELETKENNININIDKYTYNKKLTEKETEKLSSNLIKYIANRIKIAKLKRTIEEYNKKISKTNLEKIAIEEEKNKIKELCEVLKTNFYNLSGIETIPNNYSLLEEYEKINDARIIDRITELKLEIAKLKNELLIYETIDTKEEEETKKK